MVNRTTGGAMVMTVKVTDMTVDTFAGTVQGRSFAGAGPCLMTGLTAARFMDITDVDKQQFASFTQDKVVVLKLSSKPQVHGLRLE